MNPSPTRLHDFPFSGNGYKVRLALAQLGFKVDYQIADILAGETATERFLAMNPMGQIPVLELSDGTYLRESNAILYWLSENTALMPTSHLARTRVVQLADQNFLVADAYSAADICLYGYVHCAEEGGFDLKRFKWVSAWLDNVHNQTDHITIDQY